MTNEGGEGHGPRPQGGRRRRRGRRGGRGRQRSGGPRGNGAARAASPNGDGNDVHDDLRDDLPDDEAFDTDSFDTDSDTGDSTDSDTGDDTASRRGAEPANDVELPEHPREGRVQDPAVAEAALVRRPQIGDSRPGRIPPPPQRRATTDDAPARRDGRRGGSGARTGDGQRDSDRDGARDGQSRKRRRRRRGRGSGRGQRDGDSGRGVTPNTDEQLMARRRGKERDGRPVGRYLMCVNVRPDVTQVAVLEGRSLIEHYVSHPADDIGQIHGNIYLGQVQNVLPGMEAAFVDIGTPKNAVLYRHDVQFDKEDVVEQGPAPRIEHVLRNRQLILCQVTKNPIGAKGGRLTQEVSLPGRFVVLVPDSRTYGISKRLPDGERRRLRGILDRIKPEQHGVIVRTAAENATEHELTTDMEQLLARWETITEAAKKAKGPTLLYREPSLAVRVIREEFSNEYRGIIIDDRKMYEEIRDYVGAFNPDFVDRVEHYDAHSEGLPLFETHRVHEQLRKALDRKVWLPSGGSLVIEHTEALTVIDVNTGKNVGKSNLEDTVLGNNLEAAEEIARQLRLRDIGGIIVIDFIDMEVKENRRRVVEAFKRALSRDKTRTQVFDISELGLVQMTRKRIGEGLLTSFAHHCAACEGRGVQLDLDMLDEEPHPVGGVSDGDER